MLSQTKHGQQEARTALRDGYWEQQGSWKSHLLGPKHQLWITICDR
jgi:hypothetical protein